jgi:hypothetical protein
MSEVVFLQQFILHLPETALFYTVSKAKVQVRILLKKRMFEFPPCFLLNLQLNPISSVLLFVAIDTENLYSKGCDMVVAVIIDKTAQ